MTPDARERCGAAGAFEDVAREMREVAKNMQGRNVRRVKTNR